MDRQKGSLTIEATIGMVMFFIVFIAFSSLGHYTEVQNKVRHSLNQMAVSMSARNFQLSKLHEALESATGVNLSDVSEIIGWFSISDPDDMTGSGKKFDLPYTTESTYPVDKTKYNAWSKGDLKCEAARMFAYYYMDLSFKDSKKLSYSQIKAKIEEKGIKDFEMEGCGTGGAWMEDGNLCVQVTYGIDTPISFDTLFGDGKFLKFTNQVTMKLMT